MRGQGLIETILAVSVITTGLISVLALVITQTQAVDDSYLRLAGNALAWEGIEAARSMRDSNWLAGDPWDLGLDNPGGDQTAIPILDEAINSWNMDYTPNTLAVDSATAVYRKGRLFIQALSEPVGGIKTPFFRLTRIIPDGADQKKLISEVRWQERGRWHQVKVEEWIYNWR
ncbi:MAG: hypothetical protein HY602_02755 [Parcubacteria group bacterium]|nr:hypothetical protein [Parcubacteria group bacterium]